MQCEELQESANGRLYLPDDHKWKTLKGEVITVLYNLSKNKTTTTTTKEYNILPFRIRLYKVNKIKSKYTNTNDEGTSEDWNNNLLHYHYLSAPLHNEALCNTSSTPLPPAMTEAASCKIVIALVAVWIATRAYSQPDNSVCVCNNIIVFSNWALLKCCSFMSFLKVRCFVLAWNDPQQSFTLRGRWGLHFSR